MNRSILGAKVGGLVALAVFVATQTAMAQTTTNVKALKTISAQAAKQFKATQTENIRLAGLLGIPVREELESGVVREIWKFVNGKPLYYITTNLGAARTVGSSKLWPGGSMELGLSGSSVILGEWDAGTGRKTHQEYSGRITVGDTSGTNDHGAHVAGTMIATGVSANAKGMCYEGTIHGYDWNNDGSEMALEAAGGLLLSNHSYGSWDDTVPAYFGLYEGGCVERDNIAYNAPYYLICQAAGNSQTSQTTGYDTLIIPAAAKNSLTVGAIVKNSYSDPTSVVMSGFSSWGPTDDGRIKPDIVAPGVNLYSPVASSDTAYGTYSGTSMATPCTTGSLGLLTQYYDVLFPGQKMRSATLKALVIHTADEAGLYNGPDYKFGWGQLNVATAAAVMRDKVSNADIMQENTLSQGESNEYAATSDGINPIKVTLVWTDPAGPSSYAENDTTPRLVNDLDLRVTINGTTYKPWVLDPANVTAAATTGDNTLDNVEQISIPATAGLCTITVSHKGTTLQPSGSQAYSLIITGLKNPAMTSFEITPERVVGGVSATGTITLDGSAPAGGAVVTLSSSDRTIIKSPVSVKIPAGHLSATFAVKTTAVTDAQTGTVTATFNSVTLSDDLTVCPQGILSFSVSPTSVDGGETAIGTVELSLPAPAGGAIVRVASDSVKAATMDWAVFIPEGETTKTFEITTLPVTKVTAVRIRAAYPGPTRYATLTVNPPFALSTFALSKTSIKGGSSLTGTVAMTRAASSDTVVDLSSSNSGVASVPASVTIPAGSTSATFTVTTYKVTGTNNIVLSSSYSSVVKTAKLKVTK